MTKNKIKAENYGELIATIKDMELIFYQEYGFYQGKYIAILYDNINKRIYLYVDYYGSCSGCDWLEDARDWDTQEIDYKEALDFISQMRPDLILPLGKYKKNFFMQAFKDPPGFQYYYLQNEFTKEDAKLITDKINNFIKEYDNK